MTPLNRRQLLGGALALLGSATGRAAGRNEILYGVAGAPRAPIELTAGPWSALFEPDLGFLRFIRFNGSEVLRGIYAAVRDKSWGTVTPKVSNLVIEKSAEHFLVNFDVQCAEGDIDFRWKGRITGEATGVLRFEFAGKARTAFMKNRIGFAVLHPLEGCVGQKAVLENEGGLIETGTFPSSVSPNQPFVGLRAITHTVRPGVQAEVRFEGDTFETEDHRNWTDGNFKTYCTPLALPFPVQVRQGDAIEQTVTVKIVAESTQPVVSSESKEVFFTTGNAKTKLPMIGSGYSPSMPLLGALNAAHLRVDLKLNDPAYPELLKRAAASALANRAGLELALFVSNDADAELKAFAKSTAGLRVTRYLVFHNDEPATGEKWLRLARQHLKGAPIGGGTNQYFAELNRGRPVLETIDLAAYSVNPQVHSFDNLSLVENLSSQGDTVRSARQFLGTKPIAISPVTLRPRFNQVSKQPTVPDPRMNSLFGAAWTLGSIKYLSEASAASVTYYEASGSAGVMTSVDAVFPIYHVLADVAEFSGGEVTEVASGDKFKAAGLALSKGAKRCCIAANFSAELQVVRWSKAGMGGRVRVKSLDEHSYADATGKPKEWRARPGRLVEMGEDLEVTLLPYAVVRVDPA